VGERATLSLRPERIFVSPAEEEHQTFIHAKVEELIYHGDHIRTRFNVCGHDDFIVKIPNSIDNVSLKEGKEVNIGWMSEDCLALDG
jgi:putative spermidine/putrescine transport system ATP-binding protein